MKPLYWVLIVVVLLLVTFLIYRSNKNKQAAQQEAAIQALASQNQNSNLYPGGSSQVAQIVSSLFPFFETAATTGLIGKKDTTDKKA